MSSTAISPKVPVNAAVPVLRPEGQRDVAAEQALTRDALGKLGAAPIARDALGQAMRPGVAGVPIGTEVHRDSTGDAWTVIGATNGNLDVARNVAGTLQRASGPFGSFAKYTQQLMETPATLDGKTGADLIAERAKSAPDMWVAAPSTYDDVATKGPAARVTMVDFTQAVANKQPDTFQTNWDDVLKVRKADTLKAVALEPTAVEQVIALRRLVGDDRIVTSSIGVHDKNDRERVIGTNSMPGAGKAVLDNVQETVGWFQTKAGVNILPKGTQLVMHENNPEYIANASAGVHDGAVNINEGPHDESLRQKWLNEESGKLGQIERKINKQIHDRNDTVLNHEWGHALRGLIWGEPFPNVQRAEDLTPEQAHLYIEHSMVNEAMSDLYGVAKGHKVDFGIRKVGTTQNQSADLDRYRSLVASTPMERMDEHFGTQLVSKPALEVAKAHGYDALASITGAADTDIAAQMAAGKIDIVSVPTAASALYAAAVRRFGVNDPGVAAMRDEWHQLKVPLAPVTPEEAAAAAKDATKIASPAT